jgi:very-short-patch-repair endonuclease
LRIELDGPSHYTLKGIEYDKKQNHFITDEGIKSIRIINTEIIENLDGVIAFFE